MKAASFSAVTAGVYPLHGDVTMTTIARTTATRRTAVSSASLYWKGGLSHKTVWFLWSRLQLDILVFARFIDQRWSHAPSQLTIWNTRVSASVWFERLQATVSSCHEFWLQWIKVDKILPYCNLRIYLSQVWHHCFLQWTGVTKSNGHTIVYFWSFYGTSCGLI